MSRPAGAAPATSRRGGGRRLAAAGLGLAAGVWLGYAGLPHLRALGCVRRGPAAGRRLALTFDDGPDPAWTPRVLDELAARAVRATFFVVGRRAARAPEVVRALAAAGHEVGNHTWSHANLWVTPPAATDDEVGRCHDLLGDLTGRPPRFFRPPWGLVNAALFGALRRRGERCVLWSVQPEGLRARPGPAQARHVLRRARPGAIVDLHDADGVPGAPGRLVAALPPMIDGLREAGYELVTLADLLTGPPAGRAAGGPARP